MAPRVYGKLPSGERLRRIERSPNYRDGKFRNLEPTTLLAKGASYRRMLRDHLRSRDTVPPLPIPSVRTDLKAPPSRAASLVWFGHSSYLIQSRGTSILVDPVFGSASPVPFLVRPFPGADIYTADDLPPIDALVLTHDHYDHLESASMERLRGRVPLVIAPLGVGAHLERWGIGAQRIVELDWGERAAIGEGIEAIATPARHFSGRGLVRSKTLWASYVLRVHGLRLFLGGDSGYDAQFARTGEAHGPFDLAILECGQYNESWPHIHMFPEQTAAAARDLRARIAMPVHWAKFALGNHPWDEPVKRLLDAAAQGDCAIVTPRIGERYEIGSVPARERWWELAGKREGR